MNKLREFLFNFKSFNILFLIKFNSIFILELYKVIFYLKKYNYYNICVKELVIICMN